MGLVLDEPAVLMETGHPVGDEKLAYRWAGCIALSHWDAPKARQNPDNYAMFAKVVYLGKLYPDWSFASGFAAPR